MSTGCDVTRLAELIACCVIALFSFGTESTDNNEYCLTEHFNASCPAEDDVILMTSAFYGRMHLGRCIRGDYNLGCSNDVIGHFDAVCSGRKSCDVPVRSLVDMKPCQRDFASFLEAAYECVTVLDSRSTSCPPEGRLVITASSGYLGANALRRGTASTATSGRRSCPWVIQSRRGQRVQLSLVFLDSFSAGPPAEEPGVCPRVVVLDSDVGRAEEFDSCASRMRERVLFKSMGHQVTVYTTTTTTTEVALNEEEEEEEEEAGGRRFLLSFKVIGCPLLNVSGGVWVKPIGDLGDDLMIRCNDTLETWYVTCHGNRWMGSFGNCSTSPGDLPTINGIQRRGIATLSVGFLTQGLLLALGLGLILGILIAFAALIGICCFKHWCRQNEPAKVLTSYGEEVSVVNRRFPALLTDIDTVAHLGLENVYLAGSGGGGGGGGGGATCRRHRMENRTSQGHKVNQNATFCDLHHLTRLPANHNGGGGARAATVGTETVAVETGVTKSDSDRIVTSQVFGDADGLLQVERYPPGLRTPEQRLSIG